MITSRMAWIMVAVTFMIAGLAIAVAFEDLRVVKRDEEIERLRRLLEGTQRQLDAMTEDAQGFNDDWRACEARKGFAWRERMEALCAGLPDRGEADDE